MPRLLIVHHTPSPAVHAMLTAAQTGATNPEIQGVEVVLIPALHATVPDVLAADAYLLGTPANLGYISGALKQLLRPDLLPMPRGHGRPPIWRVPPREHRHDGRPPGYRLDHHRAAVAPGASTCDCAQRADPGGPRHVLGARRGPRRRADADLRTANAVRLEPRSLRPRVGSSCGGPRAGRARSQWSWG